jgi:hypothetical protein
VRALLDDGGGVVGSVLQSFQLYQPVQLTFNVSLQVILKVQLSHTKSCEYILVQLVKFSVFVGVGIVFEL